MQFALIYRIKNPYLDANLAIITNEPSVIDLLSKWYGFMFKMENHDADSENDISVSIRAMEQGGYSISYLGRVEQTDSLAIALNDILFFHSKQKPGYYGLHAGAVGKNGKAYLFSGFTTAGKTTLTAYLCACGWGYLSDDCVFLNRQTSQVLPYPKPIHLRQGGYDVLVNSEKMHESMEWIQDRYVYTPSTVIWTPMDLEKIFFIERATDNAVRRMTAALSIETLMKNASAHYDVDIKLIQFLNGLSSKCFYLKYNDLEYVRRRIDGDEP